MERLDTLPEDKQDIVLQQMLAITKTLEEYHNNEKIAPHIRDGLFLNFKTLCTPLD